MSFFLFNSFIVSFILIVRVFIVKFCNPLVDYKTAQKVFSGLAIGSVFVGTFYAYIDFAATSGIIEPVRGLFRGVTKNIQNSQLGFSSKTSTGVIAGKAHLLLFPNELVPTIGGVVDQGVINTRLIALGVDNINSVNKSMPFGLKGTDLTSADFQKNK